MLKISLDTAPASTAEQARRQLIRTLDAQYSGSGILQRRLEHFRIAASWVFVIRSLRVVRRLFDVVLAGLLLFLFAPLLVFLSVLARRSGGAMQTQVRLGRFGAAFSMYKLHFGKASFWSKPIFCGLPALLNVLKGQMSFIGPRPVAVSELPASERAAWKRFDMRPGLLNLWWLRQQANIAYTNELAVDAEYVETNSFWGDVGMSLRALPALAYGRSVAVAPDPVTLLGVSMNNLTMAEASEAIATSARMGKFTQVCFVNAECVNIAFRDADYKSILCQARYVLADGIGVRLAGKLLNQNIRENVNGTDMLPYLCAALERAGLSLYLLGGRAGVPEAVGAWIAERYPNLPIRGCRDGYFSHAQNAAVTTDIRESGAQVLLAAMGVPVQEKWIAEHAAQLGDITCIGVGGLFDFYSGRIPRAPIWMRELGMEWLYRFLQEPGRMWKRYFYGNAVFLFRLFREKYRARGCGADHGDPA